MMSSRPFGQSNAALKKQAAEAEKDAHAACDHAEATGGGHVAAVRKLGDAADLHHRAGNASKAKELRSLAKGHEAQASAERTMRSAADQLSGQAHQASQQAALRAHGEPPEPEWGDKDTRDEPALHKAAAELHARAGVAQEAAGDKRAAALHKDMAAAHLAKSGADAGSDS